MINYKAEATPIEVKASTNVRSRSLTQLIRTDIIVELKEFKGDGGAGFGVGQRVVVIFEVVAAGGCRDVELMTR